MLKVFPDLIFICIHDLDLRITRFKGGNIKEKSIILSALARPSTQYNKAHFIKLKPTRSQMFPFHQKQEEKKSLGGRQPPSSSKREGILELEKYG